MASLAVAVVACAGAGCYSPKVQQGAPCSPDTNLCPASQTCQFTGGTYTCTSATEDAAQPSDGAVVDSAPAKKDAAAVHDDAPPPPDAASGPTITYVQSADAKPTATSTTLALPAAVGARDAIIVCLNYPSSLGATLSPITDSLGSTYDLVVGPITSSNSEHYVAIATNVAGGSDTITVTLSVAPTTGADLFVLEYAGLALHNTFDVTSNATGSATAMSSGSATTNAAHELILGYAEAPSATKGSGFTTRVAESGNLVEDEVVFVTGSYDATATTTAGAWTMIMATFR